MLGRSLLVFLLLVLVQTLSLGRMLLSDEPGGQVKPATAGNTTVTQTATPAPSPTPQGTPAPGTAEIEAVSINASPPHVGTGSGSTTITEWVRNNGPAASSVADVYFNCYKDLHVHPVNCRFVAHPGDACFQSGSPVGCEDPGNIDELRFSVALPLNEPTALMRQVAISCGVAPGFGGENFTATVTGSLQAAAASPPDTNPNNNSVSAGLSVFCPEASPTVTPVPTTSTATPTPTPSPIPTPTPSPTPTIVPTPIAPTDTDGDGIPDASDLDDDNDGLLDTLESACGSDPLSAASRPERVDGAFAGVDDDGDTQTDEALPAGASASDCDTDGYTGADEDSIYAPGTTGDQDPCGTAGWPSDFVSSGVPDSTNRVTITDITSFLAPVRRLDTDSGGPNFSPRWDLVPGKGPFAHWIAISDITALIAGTTGSPPMLGGAKALNGPPCPWP